MGFKDLFINSNDENSDKKEDKPVEIKSVVETQKTVFTSNNTTTFDNKIGAKPNKWVENTIDIYKKGLESINQAGYDFFEFYQSVVHGDQKNPQTYIMAFAMGQAMDKSITKDKLLTQSDYYISELNKVYNDNVAKGNNKKEQLLSEQATEKKSLEMDLISLNSQLESLKNEINTKQNLLNAIGIKYNPLIEEIDEKLTANEIAKNDVIQTLETVKLGIINNLR